MMPKKQLGLAVIGDEDLVSGMRLAGMSRYYVIESDHDVKEDVRKALLSFINEPDVGVIILQEDYTPFIEDIVRGLREEKKVFPVIVEVPSKHGTKHGDVTQYYKAFIRRFVGFDIQI